MCREPKTHTGRTCKLHTEWSRVGIKPMTKYTNAKAKEKTNKKTQKLFCVYMLLEWCLGDSAVQLNWQWRHWQPCFLAKISSAAS